MIDGRWKRKRRKLAQQVYHPDKDWPEKSRFITEFIQQSHKIKYRGCYNTQLSRLRMD